MTRKIADSTNVTTAEAIRALVPCVSKCWGHKGVHHGFDDRWLLYTASVCAEHAKMAMLKTMTRPVMMV
jgi:hypothetical protein